MALLTIKHNNTKEYEEDMTMAATISVICQQNGLLKTGVDLYVDKQKYHLQPQDQPYVINVVPGSHTLTFKDPSGIAKKVGRGVASAYGAVGGAIVGIGFGIVKGPDALLTGGTSGAGAGKNIGHNLGQKLFGSGANGSQVYEITFHEGDVLNITCIKDKNSGIMIKSN